MPDGMSVALTLELIDKLTAPLRKLKGVTGDFSRSLKTVETGLIQVSRGFSVLEKTVGKATLPFMKALEASQKMKDFGRGMLLKGTAGLAASSVPIINAAQFESELAEIVDLTDMTMEEFKQKYSKTILDLSAQFGKSAPEVAQAFREALKSGIDIKDITPYLTNQIKASISTGANLAESLDLATSIKNMYQLQTSEMSKVNDIIAMANKKGKMGLDEMAMGLSQVGEESHAIGFSFENIQAAAVGMSQEGLRARKSYTSLRAVIDALSVPNEQTLSLLQSAGIQLDRNTLKEKDLLGVMDIVKEKTAGMTEATRAAFLEKIFGAGGMVFVNSYLNNAEKYKDTLSALKNSQGEVEEDFKRMSNTTEFSWKQLWATTKGLSISLGNSLLPIVKGLLKSITKLVDWIRTFTQEHKLLTGIIFGAVIAVSAIVAGLGALAIAFGVATSMATKYAIMMEVVSNQKGRVLTSIKSIGAGILNQVTGLGGGAVSSMPKIGGLFGGLFKNIPKILKGVFNFGTKGSPWGWIILAITGIALAVKKYWGPIKAFAEGVWNGVKDALKPILNIFKPVIDIFKEVSEWFTNLIKPVNASKDTLNRLIERGKQIGQVIAKIIYYLTIVSSIPLRLISELWKPAKSFFGGFWDSFIKGMEPVKEAWGEIKKAFSDAFELLKPELKELWGSIKSAFGPIMDVLVKLGIIDQSTAALQGWAKAGKIVGSIIAWLVRNSPILGMIRMFAELIRIISQVISWVNQVYNYVNGLNWKQAGIDMIMSIYNGIISVAKMPVDAVKNIAQQIRDLLPFSPAKVGPLATLDQVDFAGPIMKSLDMFPGVSAMRNIAGSIMSGFQKPALTTAGGGPINLTVNVHVGGSSSSASDIAQSTTNAVERLLRKAFRS